MEHKQISKNFTSKELRVSSKYPEIAKMIRITQPIMDCAENLIKTVLQPIRDHIGIMVIDSFVRDKQLNSLVGGEKNSDHLKGCACDFVPKGTHIDEVYRWIVNDSKLKYKQVIFYPKKGFIHISRSMLGDDRCEALVSAIAGKYIPYHIYYKTEEKKNV